MQIGSGAMTFQNPYASSSLTPIPQQENLLQSSGQIANEYHLIAENLTPAERKLYDNLMFAENYEAAKGIIAIGFLRSAGMYQDTKGNPLEGVSLREDLTRMLPASDPRQNQEIQKLQAYLMEHPTALELDPQKRGNIIDFRV